MKTSIMDLVYAIGFIYALTSLMLYITATTPPTFPNTNDFLLLLLSSIPLNLIIVVIGILHKQNCKKNTTSRLKNENN